MTQIPVLIVGGIPLTLVIFGLVEFSKSFGLTGKWLTGVSMLLGVLFGMAYKFSSSGIPAGFAGWFEVVIFGLMLGLVTSGFYKFADDRFPKADKPPF